MRTCPRCNGRGSSLALVNPGGMQRLQCFTCGGAGSITEEHEVRIKRGKLLHAHRMDRLEGLYDFAERHGISLTDLSSMEAGRMPFSESIRDELARGGEQKR